MPAMQVRIMYGVLRAVQAAMMLNSEEMVNHTNSTRTSWATYEEAHKHRDVA